MILEGTGKQSWPKHQLQDSEALLSLGPPLTCLLSIPPCPKCPDFSPQKIPEGFSVVEPMLMGGVWRVEFPHQLQSVGLWGCPFKLMKARLPQGVGDPQIRHIDANIKLYCQYTDA